MHSLTREGIWLVVLLALVLPQAEAKSNSATSTIRHYTSFSVTPNVGYFVIDKLAVGAGLGLGVITSKGDGNDNSKYTNTKFTLTPFVGLLFGSRNFLPGSGWLRQRV